MSLPRVPLKTTSKNPMRLSINSLVRMVGRFFWGGILTAALMIPGPARAENHRNSLGKTATCSKFSKQVRVLAFSKKRSKTALVESVPFPNSVDRGGSRKLVLGALSDSVTSLEEVVDAQGALHRESAVGTQVALPFGLWRVTFADGTKAMVTGTMEISASSDAPALQFILELPLEDYVARTVASETFPKTPPQALRAQAVVARSFAIQTQHRHEAQGAHQCDLAHCQVLSWAVSASHLQAAQEAAKATWGEILAHASDDAETPSDTRPLIPLFHASCGGETASASAVFDGLDLSGSAPVTEEACASETWRTNVPSSQVRELLQRHLEHANSSSDQGAFAGISFIRDGHGRVLQLKSVNGRVLSGEAFVRHLGARVGYGKIPSALFTVISDKASKTVIFRGRGRGHGVGMCQAGAARMARQRVSYREILGHYFPKAKIISVCDTPKAP